MFCRKCGSEISDDVDFCPKCGFPAIKLESNSSLFPRKNEPNFTGLIGGVVIFVVVIIIFSILGKTGAKDDNSSNIASDSSISNVSESTEATSTTNNVVTQSTGTTNSDNNSNTNSSTTNSTVTYSEVDASTLLSDLQTNALRAEQTYQDEYVKVKGYLVNIDSDGAYFSIDEDTSDWDLISIMCDINTEDIRNEVSKLNINDYVEVKGQITEIGEIIGYVIDIDDVKLVKSSSTSSSNTNNSTNVTTNTSNTTNTSSGTEYYDWDSQTTNNMNTSGDNFVGSWIEVGNEQSGVDICYYPDDNLYSFDFWTATLYETGGMVRTEYIYDGPYFASLDDANTMSMVGSGEVFTSDGSSLFYVRCGTMYVRY